MLEYTTLLDKLSISAHTINDKTKYQSYFVYSSNWLKKFKWLG